MSAPLSKFEQLTLNESMRGRRGQPARGPPATPSLAGPSVSSEDVRGLEELVGNYRAGRAADLFDALEAPEPGLVNGLLHSGGSKVTPRQRAIEVRDILSTFDRRQFPSEFIKDKIFDRVEYLEDPRPIEDCVEKEDLEATWFILGVNRSVMFWMLRELVPEERCAQYFAEKLKRRIDDEMEELDELGKEATAPPGPNQPSVDDIAANLRTIVERVRLEQLERRHENADVAKHLVYLLHKICQRNSSGSRERSSGARRSLRGGGNIFQILIGNAPTQVPHFALDALDVLPAHAIAEQGSGLDAVRELLIENGIRKDSIYLREFDRIRARPMPVVEPGETSSGRKRPAGGNERGEQKRPNRA